MAACDDATVPAACELAADASAAMFSEVVQTAATQLSGVVTVLLDEVWAMFDNTTVVDVTTGPVVSVYNLVFGVAVSLTVAFFLLQLGTGMLRRDAGALGRAVGGLVKSVLGSFLVISLTATALEITDRICVGIVHATGTTIGEVGAQLTGVFAAGLLITAPSPGVGPLLALFVASLALCGAFMIWIGLLTRQALLLVSVALAPIALAGAAWDATRGWVGRWLTFVVALVLCKIVVVVILLLAAGLVTAPLAGEAASVGTVLTGAVLLLVAGFAPYMSYKMVSFVGFDLYTAMSLEQETKQAMNRPVPVVPPSALGAGIGARSVPNVLRAGGAFAGASGGAGGASGAATGAAAAGPVAVGVGLAGAAAKAGPALGRVVAGQASAQVPEGGSAPSHPAASSPSGTVGGGRPATRPARTPGTAGGRP